MFNVKRRVLCELLWQTQAKEPQEKIDFVISNLNLEEVYYASQIKEIRSKLLNVFWPYYYKRWQEASRTRAKFELKFKAFLEGEFEVPLHNIQNYQHTRQNSFEEQCTEELNICEPPRKVKTVSKGVQCNNLGGRPEITYNNASKRTKRKRSNALSNKYCTFELGSALKRRKIYNIGEDGLDLNDMKSYMRTSQVLAMYLDCKLTATKYSKFKKHNELISSGGDSYPSYKKLEIAKHASYPSEINVNVFGACAPLFCILENTLKKIILLQNKDKWADLSTRNLILEGKMGMDGASGQQETRQAWSTDKRTGKKVGTDREFDDDDDESDNETIGTEELNDGPIENLGVYDSDTEIEGTECEDVKSMSDKNVFGINFVPLQLRAGEDIVWANKTPSSIHYCRPVEFQFTKEEKNVVINRYEHYSSLLEKVKAWNFWIEGLEFTVSFNIKFTMIDGKICNFLTKQDSTKSCNICRVTPGKINDLEHVKSLRCYTDYYKFGLSTLHGWIKCLEYILHLSYKLEVQEGDDKETKKAKIAEQKKKVQLLLKQKLHLSVDIVKQGFGTTNTGNVARKFFRNSKVSAKCTGIDQDLIERLYTILQVLTCGKKPRNIEKYKEYAYKTAEICTEKYWWYTMPPSLHKILIHGGDIIESFDLPIGWYSEEAQECNNKIFRQARANFSRMTSREQTNIDTIRYLFLHSDPLIASLRDTRERLHNDLTEEADRLLV